MGFEPTTPLTRSVRSTAVLQPLPRGVESFIPIPWWQTKVNDFLSQPCLSKYAPSNLNSRRLVETAEKKLTDAF